MGRMHFEVLSVGGLLSWLEQLQLTCIGLRALWHQGSRATPRT